ncbi:MAG TPA: type II toxin-antitoxin system VapC family toxin [Terriglobia bacterium]|nr:type II toxin-antitoxin system VapC family toxin [Terriglobia bacterium]
MILYLDTRALVKLFFREAGSKVVVDLVGKADSVITSQVAYAESCSALARRKRDKRLTEEEFETARKHLDETWPQMDTILVDEIKAGELAIKHVIRGFDAIHLAAALELRTIDDKAIEVTFCSFDDRQNDAARAEDLAVVESE